MSENEQSSSAKDLGMAIVAAVVIAVVMAVIYAIFRAAGLVGSNWG